MKNKVQIQVERTNYITNNIKMKNAKKDFQFLFNNELINNQITKQEKFVVFKKEFSSKPVISKIKTNVDNQVNTVELNNSFRFDALNYLSKPLPILIDPIKLKLGNNSYDTTLKSERNSQHKRIIEEEFKDKSPLDKKRVRVPILKFNEIQKTMAGKFTNKFCENFSFETAESTINCKNLSNVASEIDNLPNTVRKTIKTLKTEFPKISLNKLIISQDSTCNHNFRLKQKFVNYKQIFQNQYDVRIINSWKNKYKKEMNKKINQSLDK